MMGSEHLHGIKKSDRIFEWKAALRYLRDLVVILATLPLVFPLSVAVALSIKLGSPGALLYYHPRLGKNGKSILVIKFRTMHLNSAPPEGSDTDTLHMKPENDNRVTAIGRLLRKYSLDEMPQYINVLKGELSLIGPRAITPDEAEAYGVHRDLILSVLPGITGWWQVNGRNNMTWERRVELELDYVTNPSWKKDAFIIFKTIFVILKGTGR